MSPAFSLPTRGANSQPKVTWPEWIDHLSQRRVPTRSTVHLADGKRCSPLLWALPDDESSQASARFIEGLCRGCRSKSDRVSTTVDEIDSWLTKSKDQRPDPGFALECLAVTRALPMLVNGLDADLWWDLLTWLVETAADATALSLDSEPLSHQLCAGELALTIVFLFPEIKFRNDLERQARVEISRGIVEILDGEGTPHARHLQWLRPLMASWTRSFIMSAAMSKHVIKRGARNQYEWLVRQSMRLTRADRRQILSGCDSAVFKQDLIDAALRVTDDPVDVAISQVVSAAKRSATQSNPVKKIGRAEPFVHSEWAELSVLRSSWQRKSERFTLTHTNRHLMGELENSGDLLLSGIMDPMFMVDGSRIQPREDWEVVCWFTDNDGDYLEIECVGDDGWTFQRQVFLGRVDRFLFLADVLLGTTAAELSYQCDFPIGAGVTALPAEDSNECYFANKRNQPRTVCLPLALPEWRSDRRIGTLTVEDGVLRLRQSAISRGLYAPLFFDLDTRRMRRSLTWRQLTVGERLKTVPPDVATGFRVQLGKKQWLVYRSLAARTSRTVLGQNLSTECLIARFKRDGTTEALVEIE